MRKKYALIYIGLSHTDRASMCMYLPVELGNPAHSMEKSLGPDSELGPELVFGAGYEAIVEIAKTLSTPDCSHDSLPLLRCVSPLLKQ